MKTAALLRVPDCLAVVLLCCAAGCVTTVVEDARKPAAEITWITTQTGDETTLHWESDPAIFYTVLYADRKDAGAEWKPLPGYVRMKGTGQEITVTDTVPPGEKRHYRVYPEPLTER